MLQAFAWGGALLFATSLGYFAYFHTVVLGRADAGTLPLPAAIGWNVLLFSAFALHHSVMARSGAKRWLAIHASPRVERSLYVWVASVLFLAVCLWWEPLPGTAYAAAPPLSWLLRAGQLMGVWLTLRGASVIDPLELAGIRQAGGRERPPRFKVVGPFRLVRHPIYLGWVLMVFCAPAMTSGRLLWAIVSTAYLVIAIPFEERSLIETFGTRYEEYQRAVPARLFPGLW